MVHPEEEDTPPLELDDDELTVPDDEDAAVEVDDAEAEEDVPEDDDVLDAAMPDDEDEDDEDDDALAEPLLVALEEDTAEDEELADEVAETPPLLEVLDALEVPDAPALLAWFPLPEPAHRGTQVPEPSALGRPRSQVLVASQSWSVLHGMLGRQAESAPAATATTTAPALGQEDGLDSRVGRTSLVDAQGRLCMRAP